MGRVVGVRMSVYVEAECMSACGWILVNNNKIYLVLRSSLTVNFMFKFKMKF